MPEKFKFRFPSLELSIKTGAIVGQVATTLPQGYSQKLPKIGGNQTGQSNSYNTNPYVEHDYDLMDINKTEVNYRDEDEYSERTVTSEFDNNGYPYTVVKHKFGDGSGYTDEIGGSNGVNRFVTNMFDQNDKVVYADTAYNGLRQGDPGYIQLQLKYNQGAIRRKQGGLMSYLNYIK